REPLQAAPAPPTGQVRAPVRVPVRVPVRARLCAPPSSATARSPRRKALARQKSASCYLSGSAMASELVENEGCLAAAAGDLGPAIAQSDRAVEHEPVGRRIR